VYREPHPIVSEGTPQGKEAAGLVDARRDTRSFNASRHRSGG
jgi:hypothetical protein